MAKFQALGEFRPERGGTVATVMLEDHQGAVWIGTSFSGLFRYDESGFESIQTTHQEILSLAEDREGNLWVGTAGGGLNRIRRRAVTLEGPEAGIAVRGGAIHLRGRRGHLWAATQNGVLVRRVGGKWSSLAATNNWPVDATCVAADAQGTLWIGTRLHGLYCWRQGRFVNWGNRRRISAGRPSIPCWSASRATCGSVKKPRPSSNGSAAASSTRFVAPHDSRIIRAMAEDAAGNIWAGTSKGVMLKITGDQLAEVKLRPRWGTGFDPLPLCGGGWGALDWVCRAGGSDGSKTGTMRKSTRNRGCSTITFRTSLTMARAGSGLAPIAASSRCASRTWWTWQRDVPHASGPFITAGARGCPACRARLASHPTCCAAAMVGFGFPCGRRWRWWTLRNWVRTSSRRPCC